MSCKPMVDRYLKTDEGKSHPLPPDSSSPGDKRNWILSDGQWGCILDGKFSSDHKACEQKYRDVVSPYFGPSEHKADYEKNAQPVGHLNQYREDGFMDWVSKRGYTCLRRIIGDYHEEDEHGIIKIPGKYVAFPSPLSYSDGDDEKDCANQCRSAVSSTHQCFSCLNRLKLSDIHKRCPAIDPEPSSTKKFAEEIREAITCQACIGVHTKLAEDPSTNKAYIRNINDVWGCIKGTHTEDGGPGLSEGAIIAIALVVLLVSVMIGMGIRMAVIKYRHRGPSTAPVPGQPQQQHPQQPQQPT